MSYKLPNDSSKRWIHRRLAWLLETFGTDRIKSCRTLRPTPEDFPAPWDGSIDGLSGLMDLLTDRYSLSGQPIVFGLDPEAQTDEVAEFLRQAPPMAGCFMPLEDGRLAIMLHPHSLDDRAYLVGVLGHELGHVLHYVSRTYDFNESPLDSEPLTDLTAIAFGLGVFSANASFRVTPAPFDQRITGAGYMTAQELCYGLALVTRLRGESADDIAEALALEQRGYYRAAMLEIDHLTSDRIAAGDLPDEDPDGDAMPYVVQTGDERWKMLIWHPDQIRPLQRNERGYFEPTAEFRQASGWPNHREEILRVLGRWAFDFTYEHLEELFFPAKSELTRWHWDNGGEFPRDGIFVADRFIDETLGIAREGQFPAEIEIDAGGMDRQAWIDWLARRIEGKTISRPLLEALRKELST